MITKEKQWQNYVALVEHYRALGKTEIPLYLSSGCDPLTWYPWHLAQSCEPWGTHRMDITTGVRFYGEHYETGLKFIWTWQLEPWNANGSPEYHIDAMGAIQILKLLPEKAANQFASYIRTCAIKVQEKADEYKAAAIRQERDVNILLGILADRTGKKEVTA